MPPAPDPAETSPTKGGSTAPPSAPAASSGPTEPAGTVSVVQVVLTFAGWDANTESVQVGAYVTAVEPAGSCTLTLRSGTAIVTTGSDALTDATSMACGTLSVPQTELTPGSWEAEVTYASPSSQGASEVVTLEVPQ